MAKTSANKTTRTNKKTNTNKKGTSTRASGKDILIKEITGIFLVSFAVFMIIVTTGESQTGIIGRSINSFTNSAFGAGSEVLPYFLLAIGVTRLLNIVILNDNNQIAAIIGFFICFIIYRAVSDPEVYSQIALTKDLQELFIISKDLGMAGKGGVFPEI